MVYLNELNPLFVFDMANNHMGSMEHGLRTIKAIHDVCKDFPFKFGFKLQYRHLDTLIHPDYTDRTDFKYIKRFKETRLDPEQLQFLKDEMQKLGFVTLCTPYDESSVDLLEEHGFDIIKVASCSFTDWLLWEKIVKTDKPIIASTAGASLEDIEKVVSFSEHRQKDFALMHCVAEYPTQWNHAQLNQIDLFKAKFPQVRIGYSTHESPDNFDAIKIAIAKGATIFEKHVGILTEKYTINAYSATPQLVQQWLQAADNAFETCGLCSERAKPTKWEAKELLGLRRGMFAKVPIPKGEQIKQSDIFLALPTIEGQFTANDMGKYCEFYASTDIDAKSPLLESTTTMIDTREKVYAIIKQVRHLAFKSGVPIPQKVDVEVSHHYGIDRFSECGATIFTIVNREYCKKLIILLAGQRHPEQYHKQKDETFHVLYGDLIVNVDGRTNERKVGDLIIIDRGMKHSFSTKNGVVIEEISSTHYKDDSYYTDDVIMRNKNRKTQLTYWLD